MKYKVRVFLLVCASPRISIPSWEAVTASGSAKEASQTTHDTRNSVAYLHRLRWRMFDVEQPDVRCIPDAQRHHATNVDFAPDERSQPNNR